MTYTKTIAYKLIDETVGEIIEVGSRKDLFAHMRDRMDYLHVLRVECVTKEVSVDTVEDDSPRLVHDENGMCYYE